MHKRQSRSKRPGSIVMAILGMALAAMLVTGACSSKPQTFKVGILCGHDALAVIGESFKAKMTELGYVENENVVYSYQSSGFAVDMELYAKLCQRLVDDKVDLVVTFPTEASIIAKQVLNGRIPLVFSNASTEGTGLINSIQSPGTNITGLRYPTPEIALRRLEALQQIKPTAKRILAPYLKDYPTMPSQIKALDSAIKDSGIELLEVAVASPPELNAALETAKTGRIDGVLLFSDPLSVTPDFVAPVFAFAGRQKIPISVIESSFAGVDFTIGVMIDVTEVGKEAAVLADKILKGTPAGSIPVATSNNYLTINLKAAQRLGLTVPDGLLKQAVKVIR